MLNSYSSLLKLTGSIKHRDKIGETISSLLRQIYSEEWRHLNSSNVSSIHELAGIIRQQGIVKLPNQPELTKKLKNRCDISDANNNDDRTVVIPDEKYIDLLIPLLLNEELITLVSHYLGAPARLQSWCISWNNRGNDSKEENGQLYHRDRDDFRSLRLYLYLSDVDHINGPHYYLKGSHTWDLVSKKANGKKLHDLVDDTKHAFMNDELIFTISAFEKKDEVCLIGKQGFCWLEDGGGLHKGSVPTEGSSSRLMLSITWGLYEGAQYENGGGKIQLKILQDLIKDQKIKLSIIQQYAVGIKKNATNHPAI